MCLQSPTWGLVEVGFALQLQPRDPKGNRLPASGRVSGAAPVICFLVTCRSPARGFRRKAQTVRSYVTSPRRGRPTRARARVEAGNRITRKESKRALTLIYFIICFLLHSNILKCDAYITSAESPVTPECISV
ncbi:hypothetical protein EYF80_052268 [Liparis tanakae]|uniref:Uncharacterized protein n=1 Tax=Liparis tanakae TaxID=230148 RepID=A0A4Z2F8S9_9TELE|nr:hypothetical protein EYF80_052268 [Liparis tanakae]